MGHCYRAWKQCCQQLRLPMIGHPRAIRQLPRSKRLRPVIVVKLKHPRRAVPTSKHEPRLAPSCCKPPVEPQPSMDGVSPCVIVAEPRPRHSRSDFTLQDSPPRDNQVPRSKAQPLKETSKPQQKSICDAFRKGATPVAPPSQGFHTWMKELEGNTTPPTRKAAPTGVTIAKAFAQEAL
jgi:hypothetical protein